MPGVIYTSEVQANPARATVLQEAINGLPASGGEVRVNTDLVLTAPIEPRSNVSILGLGRPVITMLDASAPVFRFYNAENVRIAGLSMRGGRSGVTAWDCVRLSIQHCSIEAWAFRAIDIGAGSHDLLVEKNYLTAPTAGAADAIFIQDSDDVSVRRNVVETRLTGDHGIAIHSYLFSADRALVENNRITHGGPNFAIEVGSFNTGARITDATVRANRIVLLAPGNGGISMSRTDSAFVERNRMDLGGFAPGISALELADSQAGNVNSNTVHGGAADCRAFALDSSSDAKMIGNRFEGLVVIENSHTFAGVVGLARNTFLENTFTMPAGSVTPWKVLIKNNVAGGDATANRFYLNRGLVREDVRMEPDLAPIPDSAFIP